MTYASPEGVLAAQMTAASLQSAPSVLYRPKLMADGDMWFALYGDNLQEGVAGFGKTPAEAMYAFDEAWTKSLTPAAVIASKKE
jgi:hypothetical protein